MSVCIHTQVAGWFADEILRHKSVVADVRVACLPLDISLNKHFVECYLHLHIVETILKCGMSILLMFRRSCLWHLSFKGRALQLTVLRLSCVRKALSQCCRYFQGAVGARQ